MIIALCIAAALLVIAGLLCRFRDSRVQARFLLREEAELRRLLQACREQPPDQAASTVCHAIQARHDRADAALDYLMQLAARDDPDDMEARDVTAALRRSLQAEMTEMSRLLQQWGSLPGATFCRQFQAWAEEKLGTTLRELRHRSILRVLRCVPC